MTELSPVGSIGLSERVEAVLADRILSGTWQPGQSLPTEIELCGQLKVSRSVVRGAVRTLVARGLVTVRQGVGMTVAEPSHEVFSDAILVLLLRSSLTINEVLGAREMLEISLAGNAAERRTENDLRMLASHADELRRAAAAVDWTEATRANLSFHLAILDAVNLPALQVLLRPLHEIILATSHGPVERSPELWDVAVHQEIVDAIGDGNDELARDAMRRHFAFSDSSAGYGEYHAMLFRDAAFMRNGLDWPDRGESVETSSARGGEH